MKKRKNPLSGLSRSQQDHLLADAAIAGALIGSSIEEKMFMAIEAIPGLLMEMRRARQSKTPPSRTDGPEAPTQAE